MVYTKNYIIGIKKLELFLLNIQKRLVNIDLKQYIIVFTNNSYLNKTKFNKNIILFLSI